MDIVTEDQRKHMMASVRSKNTKIELDIRRCLFKKGYRYRLYNENLPGKPDLTFAKYSAVIFIHGCFWHQHKCDRSKLPKTRRAWWKNKLSGNQKRDRAVVNDLKKLGWRVMIIWECAVRKSGIDKNVALDRILVKTTRFLDSDIKYLEYPKV